MKRRTFLGMALAAPLVPFIGGRDEPKHRPYIVGKRGPEWFIPAPTTDSRMIEDELVEIVESFRRNYRP